jgi:hypothetical protein
LPLSLLDIRHPKNILKIPLSPPFDKGGLNLKIRLKISQPLLISNITLPFFPSFRTRALSLDPERGLGTKTPEGQDESLQGRGIIMNENLLVLSLSPRGRGQASGSASSPASSP